MKIVIVEDEKLIREGLADMVQKGTGHKVVAQCKNGIEGIAAVQEYRPDLVITDIRMNDMNGLDMLTKIREQGIKASSIIISGYSEFEYARKAMRLGVEEYLLKPVSIDTLRETVRRIEGKLTESRNRIVKQPGNYLKEYFFGSDLEQTEAKQMLHRIFPEEKGKMYGVLLGYFGETKVGRMNGKEFLLQNMMHQFTNINYLDAWEEQMRFRIVMLKATEGEIEGFIHAFNQMLEYDFQVKKKEVPWAIDLCSSIEEWKASFENDRKLLSFCLSFGCRSLLRVREVSGREWKGFDYPIQTEKKIISAIGNGERKEAEAGIDEFLSQIIKENYDPEEIRHSALKLMANITDIAKEINQKAYEKLREEDNLKGVLKVYTAEELKESLRKTAQIICDRKEKEGISNYTINRTLEYIRNHYKEGISLEKTAEVLNITPEYLSMLFKREIGMNFSVFLKEFRISHAKRLLKESDMKIYEVAQECGYSNSNYFARIFKEVTGVSPAEYR
ncbi:response regulator [Lachnospiraceae bacterium 29-84]